MVSDKPDWSQKCWRDMLIYQRKSMYRDETLENLAAWIEMEPGQTIVDVGCGLGYLGYTYWKYFGRGGRYIGIDGNAKLIADAREAAHDWAVDGEAEFIKADAYALPLEDNAVDLALCQALLMHMERPTEALAEMIRITKPGGSIVCKEPDNLSAAMSVAFWSLPELSIEEIFLSKRVSYLANKGRIKLGRGDNAIALKLPHMMSQLGLTGVEIRINDKIHFLEPPYDSELQQDALAKIKKHHFDDDRRRTLLQREREEFIAGGGTDEEFDRAEVISDKLISALKKQIEDKSYYICSPGSLYIIKGQKAK